EPFAVYTTQGNWILIAFCQLKQDFRAFRLDRIQRLLPTGIHFEPHRLSLEEYLEQCRKKWLHTPDIPLSQAAYTFAVHQKLPRMQKEQIAPFLFAGIGVRTSNQNAQAAQDIGALWQRFLGEQIATKIPNVIDPTVLAVYTDYEGDHNQPYTALIGCRVSSLEGLPEGLQGYEFPGGEYAKWTATGNINQGMVAQTWGQIWSMDLDRKYVADFEVYDERARNPEAAEVDIFVGIQ
ncbi:MAG: effector binding domain-containing protein, partial [Bacteroidota bacterium]